jgi:hypothetical protein
LIRSNFANKTPEFSGFFLAPYCGNSGAMSTKKKVNFLDGREKLRAAEHDPLGDHGEAATSSRHRVPALLVNRSRHCLHNKVPDNTLE